VSSACNQNNMICKYQSETMLARAYTSVTLLFWVIFIVIINLYYIDCFQITLYKNILNFNKYFCCIYIKFQWHNYLNIGHVEILQVKPFIFIHKTCKHKVSSACNQNNMICKYQSETMLARAYTSVTLKTCLLNIAFVKSLILDNCCWLLWLFDLK
jgi:hypothetical protein